FALTVDERRDRRESFERRSAPFVMTKISDFRTTSESVGEVCGLSRCGVSADHERREASLWLSFTPCGRSREHCERGRRPSEQVFFVQVFGRGLSARVKRARDAPV